MADYAGWNALQIVKRFEDVKTANTSGRTQFTDMVAWFKRNRSRRTLLVEKTDRLYRNFKDAVTLDDRDIEIHLVKEGQIHFQGRKVPGQVHPRHQSGIGEELFREPP